jgi:hypothetical protein
MAIDRSVNARDYQVSPDELDYDQTAALPGAEDRAQNVVSAVAGKPAQAAAPSGLGQQPQGSAPPTAPVRSLQDVEAAITGAPNAQPVPKGPLLQPHQFNMTSYDDVEKLQQAARAGGIDTDKVPPEYWQYLKNKYAAANDPGVLGVAQHFIQATGIGHFMAGWDEGGPSDTIPASDMEKMNPRMAEMRKADQFFNQNIQSRIIEKGAYISNNGANYTPPDSYKYGKMVGSVMANPASAAGIPAGAKMMVGGMVSLGSKAVGLMGQFAENYPRAADLVQSLAKWGAIGAIGTAMMGRGAPPP